MLQINTLWKLTKITIAKPYEQILTKTIYFDSPIFVEVQHVMGSPCEFSPILQK